MNSQPVKFLLVDDVEDNLVALSALLRREGLVTLCAHSGPEALELLLQHDIALALLDVQMPGMDGFELAELMRGSERTKHIPIIFVTAGVRDPARAFKGYETGAVDFLFKPIEPVMLKGKAEVFFELHRQKQKLAQLLRLHETFVAILGHDLRTPLNSMLLGAEILGSSASTDRDRETADRMIAAGQRMSRMISQVLDLTRIRLTDGSGLVVEKKEVDLVEIVQKTVNEVRGAYPEAKIVLDLCEPVKVPADYDRLVQCFTNLLGNSVVHGEAGAPIGVSVHHEGHRATVEISNNGVIPPDLLPVIFDPFRSGRSESTARSPGLGLGLFITQHIVQRHGGSIQVRSEAGDGKTSFAVTLYK